MTLMAVLVGTRPKRIEPGVTEFLMQHDWPGNVRELENVIHRIFTFERGHRSLLVSNLMDHVPVGEGSAAGQSATAASLSEADIIPLDDLEAMGQWMDRNSDSIYGTSPTPSYVSSSSLLYLADEPVLLRYC